MVTREERPATREERPVTECKAVRARGTDVELRARLHRWLGEKHDELRVLITNYQKQRVLYHHSLGLRPPTIACVLLEEEHIKLSRVGIFKFLRRYGQSASISRAPGSGRPSTITQHIKEIV